MTLSVPTREYSSATLARRLAGLATAVASVAIAAAGCSTPDPVPESEYSRVAFYDSLEALRADSDAVVVGRVVDQEVADDLEPGFHFTLTQVEVMDADATSGLAAGDTIVVRQVGGADTPPPANLLGPEDTYLLFLTLSGLDGRLATQFYPTGVVAGIYVAPGIDGDMVKSLTFTQFERDDAEDLPTEITAREALGS